MYRRFGVRRAFALQLSRQAFGCTLPLRKIESRMNVREKSDEQTPAAANKPHIPFFALALFNLLAGLVLWFLYLTDYSLVGSIADYVFPIVVGIVALGSLLIAWMARRPKWNLLALVPSLVGGGLAVVLMLLLMLSVLGFLFMADEVLNERLIQTVQSPDRERTALVYFRGVGAYDAGNGRVLVRIRERGLPLLERDVYYEEQSYADSGTRQYVRWVDRDTLTIIGEPRRRPEQVRIPRSPSWAGERQPNGRINLTPRERSAYTTSDRAG